MYSKEQYEQAFILRNQGFTYNEIAKELNLRTYNAPYNWINNNIKPKGAFLNASFNDLSNDLAYILGVIEGDGYITIKKTKGRIGLEVKDKDFYKKFKDSIEKWSGLKTYSGFNGNKGIYFSILYSLRAAKFLDNLSLDNIRNSKTEIKSSFLMGVFDSDATVAATNLNNRKCAARFICFYNTDKELIYLVRDLLESLGIETQKIKIRYGGGFNKNCIEYRLVIGGKDNLQRFYDLIGFSIKRKNDKLKLALKSYNH